VDWLRLHNKDAATKSGVFGLDIYTLDTSKQAALSVWAHNSHLGDARKTDSALSRELNLGQLVRERFGDTAT
jgi:erythromycin esterase-like protein